MIKWIEHCAQDHKVWGSIHGTGHVVEVLGKLHIPHCLDPLSFNGYLVHRSNVGSIVPGHTGAHLVGGKVKSVEHALS